MGGIAEARRKRLTDAEYVEGGGELCPSCGSSYLTKHSSEGFGEAITFPASCDDCGARWNERIELNGYTDLLRKCRYCGNTRNDPKDHRMPCPRCSYRPTP